MLVVGAALLSAALLVPSTPAAVDDVSSYLDDLGLKELLAIHLEERLSALEGEEREQVAIRLAGLYADLLETTEDVASRVDLENRSRELLQSVPEGSADELQFALLQGAYRAAERIADDYRLRRAEAAELDRGREILSDTIPRLHSMKQRLTQDVESIDRQLKRASGSQAAVLGDRSEKVRRLHQRVTFLLGWSLYYQSYLHGRSDNARAAIPHFVWVLDPGARDLRPEDVPRDILDSEAYAKTVLGLALCHSLTSGVPQFALQWLELLESQDAYEQLREQVPTWRLVVHVEHEEFREAENLFDEHEAEHGPAPLPWVRLLAVHAIEASRDSAAQRIASRMLAELATRGELQQVLDLAERYGADALGDSGFASRYVQGVRAYQAAREQHDDDQPTPYPEIRARYAQAAESFQAALDEPDADRFPTAAAGCARLIGWCNYFQTHFEEARDAFMQAAEELPAEEAPEALWMAIVSIDQAMKTTDAIDYSAELDRSIDLFLKRYPSSEYAPRLVLRRAEGIVAPTPGLVDELLAIPANSDSYEHAQTRAAQFLYELFRSNQGEQKTEYGDRYLTIALRLLFADGVDTIVSNPTPLQAEVIRARRILEVSLTDGIERTEAAAEAFQRLEALDSAGRLDLNELQDELDYRRMRAAILEDDLHRAMDIADVLWTRDETSRWARSASRSIFRIAYQAWRAEQDSPDARFTDVRQFLDRIVTYGERTLTEFDEAADATMKPTAFAYYVAVADATYALYETGHKSEIGERALQRYQTLLEHYPKSAEFLYRVGVLAEAFEQYQVALKSWRALVEGSPDESSQWFEARYRQIRVLAILDPEAAIDVMRQHKALYPQFGPAPWGPKLREVDARLSVLAEQEQPADQDGAQ